MNNEYASYIPLESRIDTIIFNIDRNEQKLVDDVEQMSPGHRFGKNKMNHEIEMANSIDSLVDIYDVSKENAPLLKVICRGHDIGRHISVIKNEVKDGGKHGQWSVDWLNENRLLDLLNSDQKEIVEFAIKWHSTMTIPEPSNNNEYRAIELCKILRDDDKLEVVDATKFSDDEETKIRIREMYSITEFGNLTNEILEDFVNRKNIDNTKIKTYADFTVLHLSYLFGIERDETILRLVSTKLEGINSRLNLLSELDPKNYTMVKEVVLKFLDEKADLINSNDPTLREYFETLLVG